MIAMIIGSQIHITPQTNAATNPANVLFGEMLCTNLRLPYFEPTRYATESETQVNNVILSNRLGDDNQINQAAYKPINIWKHINFEHTLKGHGLRYLTTTNVSNQEIIPKYSNTNLAFKPMSSDTKIHIEPNQKT